jgi:hypothetical protein
VSVRTFVISFYYGSGSGSGTVINYGSGSDFLARYGSVSASQKVTAPSSYGSGSTTLPTVIRQLHRLLQGHQFKSSRQDLK